MYGNARCPKWISRISLPIRHIIATAIWWEGSFPNTPLRKTSQNSLDIMHRASYIVGEVKGQGQGWAKGQIHLTSYNFASNCHRDFKLRSYFSSWKAAPNMDLDFWPWQVSQSSKFLKQQLWKTCQNMLGYYAYGTIYYWRSFALYEHGVSCFRCFRLL